VVAALGLVLCAECGLVVVRPVHAAGLEHLHCVVQIRMERLRERLLAVAPRLGSTSRSGLPCLLRGDRIVANHRYHICNNVSWSIRIWILADDESTGTRGKRQAG